MVAADLAKVNSSPEEKSPDRPSVEGWPQLHTEISSAAGDFTEQQSLSVAPTATIDRKALE